MVVRTFSACKVQKSPRKQEMAPRLDFSNWWAKDTRKGNPVVVTMENPNFSVVEIDGPDAAFRPVEKSRGKNAKQVTWVLLLRANRAVGCVAWLATAFWALLGEIKKRLVHRQGVTMASEKLGKENCFLESLECSWSPPWPCWPLRWLPICTAGIILRIPVCTFLGPPICKASSTWLMLLG